MMHAVDWMPTILAAAGGEEGNVCGVLIFNISPLDRKARKVVIR